MTILICLLFWGLSVDDINTKADMYVEIHSGKAYKVEAVMEDPMYEIHVRSGLMHYTETLTRHTDTLFIDRRIFKFGFVSVSLMYDPPRPRVVLPVEHNDTLYYSGNERFLGIENHIESYLITEHEKGDYNIKALTVRKNRDDLSTLVIDSTGTISYISMDLPFPILYKLLGFPERKLEFVPYEE